MNFISLHYWFSARPESLSSSGFKAITLFLCVLAILTIYSYAKTRKQNNSYKKVWQGLFNFGLTNLILGALLFFLFYESVPYLSARIGGLLWLLLMIVWLYNSLKNIKKIPEMKEKRLREQEYKKYIP